jgi:vanillate O-demethylase ferredoxin subunit
MLAHLRTIRWEAEGINSYRLEPVDGQFPPAPAGSHIDVRLPTGLTRSYSLVQDSDATDHYEIAVQHAVDGRGGSRHIHEVWRVGELVEIGEPRNNFPLFEDAPHTIFIAGGIGITPILPMMTRLEALDRSWSLHFAASERSRAAYLHRIADRANVHLSIGNEPATGRLDMPALIGSMTAGDHIYCCGPMRMIAAFKDLTASLPARRAHYELFAADTEVATEGGYKLELARSGRVIAVKPGETMLDALLSAGINVGFACSEGVCGTCEARVLAGRPDHRDHFLTEDEKAANRSVMVCCSGALTPSLTLDL